jgi:kynureninase
MTTDAELVPQAELLPGGFTAEELAALRAEFPILEGTTYLISGSLGAMPRAVADELAAFADTWARRGVRAWSEGWWESSVETADLLAPLLGVGPGEVAMHQNASVAAAVFLSALDYPAARPKLVTLALDFPTLHYVLDGERRKGAEIVWLGAEAAPGPGSGTARPTAPDAAAPSGSGLRTSGQRRDRQAEGSGHPAAAAGGEDEALRGASRVFAAGASTTTTPPGIALDQLLAAIDERTRLVAVSHALFRSSYLLDAAAVARRCREVGALLLLDAYQTAGIVPLELEAWGVDAAVGGSVKWLCGGPGNGYLWVRPELARTLRPTVTGWQADREPFAFRPGAIEPAEGAWRWLTGTPNVPAHVAARPGYRIVAGLGAERIRARSVALTGRLLSALEALPAELGFRVRSPRESRLRAGMVTVAHPAAETLCRGLLAQEVVVDYRPGAGIRLGPHVYTSEEECDRAVALLADLAGQLPR